VLLDSHLWSSLVAGGHPSWTSSTRCKIRGREAGARITCITCKTNLTANPEINKSGLLSSQKRSRFRCRDNTNDRIYKESSQQNYQNPIIQLMQRATYRYVSTGGVGLKHGEHDQATAASVTTLHVKWRPRFKRSSGNRKYYLQVAQTAYMSKPGQSHAKRTRLDELGCARYTTATASPVSNISSHRVDEASQCPSSDYHLGSQSLAGSSCSPVATHDHRSSRHFPSSQDPERQTLSLIISSVRRAETGPLHYLQREKTPRENARLAKGRNVFSRMFFINASHRTYRSQLPNDSLLPTPPLCRPRDPTYYRPTL
jgi:hypothetical protein